MKSDHRTGLWFLRLVYSVAFGFFALFYLPVFFIKGKHRAKGFKSRFGFISEDVKRVLIGQKVIWIHAVSVGEMVQAVRLSELLKERYRNIKILFTATTVTGAEVCHKLKAEEDVFLFFPIDLVWCVRSFIRATKPISVVLVETEIWPNLIFELERKNVPVSILNGRISDKAFPKYLRIKKYLAPILQRLAVIGAQDERMRFRFVALGAMKDSSHISGNMKFDWQPKKADEHFLDDLRVLIGKPKNFIFIAGSTHEGEEEILFDMYKEIKQKHPNFKMIVAPRHLTRLPAIENLAAEKKIDLKKLSRALGSANETVVYALDTMGTLAGLYALADVVFIGGSLVPVGGHNLVEPAYFEKAILHGPFMQNFKEMAFEFGQHKAALQVLDKSKLKEALLELVSDEQKRKDLGVRAKSLIEKHQGATQRNIELLSAFLEDSL